MRRRTSSAIVTALAFALAAAVVLLVPSPAHSQTGYPPGKCTPTPEFPDLCKGPAQQQQQQQQQQLLQQEQPKAATPVRGRLSLTGSNVLPWAAAAVALVVVGGLLVTTSRRRASVRS